VSKKRQAKTHRGGGISKNVEKNENHDGNHANCLDLALGGKPWRLPRLRRQLTHPLVSRGQSDDGLNQEKRKARPMAAQTIRKKSPE
jgi:hypothetical protein